MKKAETAGRIGFILYILGFVWQIFELIRNLISDTEPTVVGVYFLLAAVIIIMTVYTVMYILFFIRQKTCSLCKLIITLIMSVLILLCFGWALFSFVLQFLQETAVSNQSVLKMWCVALVSPSFFLVSGTLLIIIMTCVEIYFVKKQNKKAGNLSD